MPYSGANDADLPENVKKMPAAKRSVWVKTFNSVMDKTGKEGRAMAIANNAAKQKEHAAAEDGAPTAAEIMNIATTEKAQTEAATIAAYAAAHGHAVGEKCGECAVMVEPTPPYGGAVSFEELDAFNETMKMQGELSEASWQFETLQRNIFMNEELDAGEKADALAALAQEFKERIQSLPEGEKALVFGPPTGMDGLGRKGASVISLDKAGRRMSGKQAGVFKQAVEALKGLIKWADYDEEDPEEEKTKELVEGFKVYTDKNGATRWVAVSSNAFEDHDGEIMTTKALDNAVAWGDASGERGPLRLYHVAGADIGNCDFQAVVDRMLVESGTFYATEIGQKAARYFEKNAGKGFGVSLGFLHRIGDELDGQYDWIRIRERSITPPGKAANPFTEFALGGIPMGEITKEKIGFLSEVLGTKEAEGIIKGAQAASKALQESGIRFKEANDAGAGEPGTEKKEEPGTAAEGAAAAAAAAEGAQVAASGEAEAVEAVKELLATVGTLAAAVKELTPLADAITELRSDVAKLKETDDQKIAAALGPRRTAPPQGTRPSEKEANTVTAEAANAIAQRNREKSADLTDLKEKADGEIADGPPAAPYVADLMAQLGLKTAQPTGAAAV